MSSITERLALANQARAQRAAERRQDILDAALDEFSQKGFVGARLDDVARRAGVAKGTIYLHFKDKEALFEELIRSSLGPLVGGIEATPADVSLRAFAEQFLHIFVHEIYQTRRKEVLRLILTEGPRFPRLAHIYYRLVVKRALKAVRRIVRHAVDRGEVQSDALERFPQLLVAPALMAIIWESLFADYEPLDVAALMRTHVDLLLSALENNQ